MLAQRRRTCADLGRRHAACHLVGRPKAQRLQNPAVELAAVVSPHSSIVPAHRLEIRLLTISSVVAIGLRAQTPHKTGGGKELVCAPFVRQAQDVQRAQVAHFERLDRDLAVTSS
jgi:hypothetical protein